MISRKDVFMQSTFRLDNLIEVFSNFLTKLNEHSNEYSLSCKR